MASMKNIKKRITSVNNTKKIMKAMNLVSASKLQKAKGRLDHIRPIYDNFKIVIDEIKDSLEPETQVAFTEEREVKNIAYVVLTSDRGLCGGYNINVAKEALKFMDKHKGKHEKIISVGTKGCDYFRRRKKNVVHRCHGATEATAFESAEIIGRHVASMYMSGEADEVYIIYTHFESILTHTPNVEKLLPIRTDRQDNAHPNVSFMTYDPDVSTFLEYAVPMYLNISIYGAMMEAAVCEQASRMTSMDSATRNATEIIDDLTLDYNRKRQGMITQEITEIVSGANALQ
jgi:F-type H+-transporting ATPase subunit gamma